MKELTSLQQKFVIFPTDIFRDAYDPYSCTTHIPNCDGSLRIVMK